VTIDARCIASAMLVFNEQLEEKEQCRLSQRLLRGTSGCRVQLV